MKSPEPARWNGFDLKSSQSKLKVYHIVCEDGIRRELVAKDEVLPAVLSCLPNKYDTYTGTDMEDYQKGFCTAIDTMEQNILRKFQ